MRRTLAIGGLATAVLAGGGAWAATATRHHTGPPAAASTPAGTAMISQGDLSTSQSQSGTISQAEPRPVSGGAGTLTSTSPPGEQLTRDQILYSIDDLPVRVMYGAIPLYRPLKAGEKGADVVQLQQNLQALGYLGASADGVFGTGTADAVKSWQHDHGLKQSGVVDSSQIAFLPGPGTVTGDNLNVGDQVAPGATVLSTGGSEGTVTVPIDPSNQQLTHLGQHVQVQLPDGSAVTGTVTAIGGPGGGGGGNGSSGGGNGGGNGSSGGGNGAGSGSGSGSGGQQQINVQVALPASTNVSQLNGASVQVTFPSQTVRNVLSVPVTALLALAGPGNRYGIQLTATRQIISVTLGLFGGGGQVQVSGPGLQAGMKIVVAGT
jgi:peptidoglycan hydrolase-like protein with peptidoglycan-binding domain